MYSRYDRSALAFRRMSCELGFIAEAEGSSRFALGETLVICAVYGPGQPKYFRHEDSEGLTIDVNYSTTLGSVTGATGTTDLSNLLQAENIMPSTEQQRVERSGTRTVRAALLQAVDRRVLPRLLLSVRIMIIHDDGASLSAAIIAASLALINAGVPMLYVPVAATVAIVPQTPSNASVGVHEQVLDMYLDPNAEEEAVAKSIHCYIARCPFTHKPGQSITQTVHSPQDEPVVLGGESVGKYKVDDMLAAQQICLQGCTQIMRFVREAVAQL